MGYKRFIKVDDGGKILRDRITPGKLTGEEWIDVSGDAGTLLGVGVDKLYWDFDEKKVKRKEEIKLSVGTQFFPADGESEVAISVRGPTLDPDEVVNIRINGEPYSLTKTDDIMLSSDEPGEFEVRVDDPQYTARPSIITLVAQPVVE